MNDLFHNKLFDYIAVSWVFMLAIFFITCYLGYDKNVLLKNISNIFIEFSIIRRTKTILVSYALICLFVGVIGVIWMY